MIEIVIYGHQAIKPFVSTMATQVSLKWSKSIAQQYWLDGFSTHTPNRFNASRKFFFCHIPIEIPIEFEKITIHMGRKGPRENTEIVTKALDNL